jgi:hypothetical protein
MQRMERAWRTRRPDHDHPAGRVDIAEGIDAPGKLVVNKIQAVEGITWTLTCPAVRL